MRNLYILIADDHKLIRDGIRLMLQSKKEFHFEFDMASNGEEVLSKVKQNTYDLIFLDISMPEMTGLAALKELKTKSAIPPIIILSMHNEVSYIKKAYMNGAASYLLKTTEAEEIMLAINTVLTGKKYFNNDVANILFDDLTLANANQLFYLQHQLLSKREVQIISLYVKGLNADKIAMLLNISPRTIEGHRTNIFKKLGIKNVNEMIEYGIAQGLE
ncbi:MAG: response regulator [Crocinitomicaceae bacterium]|jgi:two-component system response regulator NreC